MHILCYMLCCFTICCRSDISNSRILSVWQSSFIFTQTQTELQSIYGLRTDRKQLRSQTRSCQRRYARYCISFKLSLFSFNYWIAEVPTSVALTTFHRGFGYVKGVVLPHDCSFREDNCKISLLHSYNKFYDIHVFMSLMKIYSVVRAILKSY